MAIDQYVANIVSLLHLDGANGGTTTTESGSAAFSPSFVGSAALSTAQAKFGAASLKTGSANGNYLRLPASRLYDLGSNDFTLECFVWPVSQGSSYGAIVGRWNDADATAQDFLLARAGDGAVSVSINGAQLIAGNAGDLPTGAFAHVALTRQGTAIKVLVNGAQVSSATLSGAINCAPGAMIIFGQGNLSGGSTHLEAYYDEWCLTVGVCRYTAAFTPMTAPYDTGDNTNYVLMLHGEGSTAGFPTDSSPFAAQGSALVGTGVTTSTTQKKFGNSSIAFDGASSIQYPNSPQFDLSTGTPDWTVEFFVYLNAYPASGNAQLLNKDAVFGTLNPSYAISLSAAGKVNLLVGNGTTGSGVQVLLGVTQVVPLTTWTHVAAVRKGTTLYVFVGGVLDQSVALTATMVNGSGTLRLGNMSGGAAGEYLYGYLDEVRITRGIGRYTTTFAPPVAAFIDDTGVFSGPPTLLLHGDGENNSTAIKDTSATQRTVTVFAGAKLSTGSVKIGTAAMRFTGSQNTTSGQDRIDIPVSDSSLTIGTQDFTIEAWVNSQATPAASQFGFLLDTRPGTSANGAYPTLYFDQNNKWVWYVNGAAQITSSIATTIGVYAHVAVVRKLNVTTMYINGAVAGSFNDNINYVAPGASRVRIGASGYDVNAANSLNAYVDEFEITVGGARYLSAFTPPTTAYPDGSTARRTYAPPTQFVAARSTVQLAVGVSGLPTFTTGQTDQSWGGKGRVAGKTTVNEVNTPQPVRLLEAGGAGLVRRAWSNADGDYAFDFIDETKRYQVIGTDYSRTYNAVIRDNITPVILPQYAYLASEYTGRMKRKITHAQTAGLGANHTVLVRVGESTGTLSVSNLGLVGTNGFLINNGIGTPSTRADVVLPLKTFPSSTSKGSYTPDINFTDLAGNPLPYWLERVAGASPNRVAFYWVNLGSQNLDSGDASFYVWYNGATPSVSTPAATFPILFDDFTFTGTNMDAAKWQAYPSMVAAANSTSSNGESYFYGLNFNALREIRTVASFGQGYEVTALFFAPPVSLGFPIVSTAGQWAGGFGWVHGTLGTGTTRLAAVYNTASDTANTRFGINGEAELSGQICFARQIDSTSQRMTLQRGTDGVVKFLNHEALIASRSGVPADSAQLCLGHWYNSGPGVDYFFVRRYSQSAPALIIGVEEQAP